MKILKNTTGTVIDLSEAGISIPASGQYTVNTTEYDILASADSVTELTTYINSGDIVVNDGVDDITVSNSLTLARAIDFLRYPDTAFNVRFLSEPDRSNGFESKDVQEAIEEVQLIAAPLIVPIALVHNGTLSNGEYIGYNNLLPGDQTPIVVPITGSFVSFTWSNSRSTADFELRFKKNSTGATPFFTWSVDNTLTANVILPTPESYNAGDTIFVQYIDQGTNASDATVVLGFKS